MSPGGLLSISSAEVTAGTKVEVTYSGEISAAGFDAGDFTSEASGETSTAVAQVTIDVIEVTFTGTVAGDDSIAYTGDKPGVLTPDGVSYS